MARIMSHIQVNTGLRLRWYDSNAELRRFRFSVSSQARMLKCFSSIV